MRASGSTPVLCTREHALSTLRLCARLLAYSLGASACVCVAYSLPLLIAAHNLHRRLRLILDDGHAYLERERSGARAARPELQSAHSKAQYELMFLVAEYMAWLEELRRYTHRNSDAHYVQLSKAVSESFSAPLPSAEEEDKIAMKQGEKLEQADELEDVPTVVVGVAVGEDATAAEPQAADDSTIPGAADAQQPASEVGWLQRGWAAARAQLGLASSTAEAKPAAATPSRRRRGHSTRRWIQFDMRSLDMSSQLPVVYGSRADAQQRQHSTKAPPFELRPTDVISVFGPNFKDGTMKFVRLRVKEVRQMLTDRLSLRD